MDGFVGEGFVFWEWIYVGSEGREWVGVGDDFVVVVEGDF